MQENKNINDLWDITLFSFSPRNGFTVHLERSGKLRVVNIASNKLKWKHGDQVLWPNDLIFSYGQWRDEASIDNFISKYDYLQR